MWSIGLLENTLKLSKDGAIKLNQFLQDDHYSRVSSSGLIEFSGDEFEHMDFLWEEAVQKIICNDKAGGRVLFGSLEGDNAGEFWGYEFKRGKLKRLVGKINWSPG